MALLADITPTLFHGVAAAGALVWLALLLLGVAALTRPAFWPRLKRHLSRFATHYSLLFAATATGGSLWLSQIAGYTPCLLCWWQRIFMYPLVVVFGVALWKRKSARAEALILAGVGALIAAYHYGIQRIGFLQKTVPCTIDASCSTMYLGYWGFYSIPLMALTCFVAILVLQAFFAKR